MDNPTTEVNQFDLNTEQDTIPQTSVKTSKLKPMYIFFTGLTILFLIGLSVNFLSKKQSNFPNSTSNYQVTPSQIPSTTDTITKPSASPTESSNATYNTQLISISYPKDWIHLTNEEYTSFPLIDLLTFPNEINKEIIVLQKDDISLIITMSKADQLEAGGIFSSDQEYSEFIQSHDLVTIQGETYYLSRIHSSLSNLLSAHSGPAAWGVLSEYIPSKMTGSGNIFKGYEQIIKKNGNMYNFIVVGETEAPTPTKLQTEIIEILESIVFIPYST
ncbi:hypothetical protein KBC89_02600 [Candidatus Woesebacteria bacterium]|nr:hypothetical protein [Candidatus Woesebacteria bacterium]